MNVAGLRVRVTIQKNEVITDKYGNHRSGWNDYFTCWANAVSSGLTSTEKDAAAITLEEDRLDITVRYCSETAPVDTTHYRVLLNGRIYGITNISDMGFKKKSRLFHTKLEETYGENDSG